MVETRGEVVAKNILLLVSIWNTYKFNPKQVVVIKKDSTW